MEHDPYIFLEHIAESIDLIEKYLDGCTKADFFKNIELQNAIVRRFEIVGEAIRNLTDDFKDKNKDVEWRAIIGMRNILAHEYFGVDLKVVWAAIEKDVPFLKEQVNKIISQKEAV